MGLCVVASDTAAMVLDAWAWEVVEVVAPFVTWVAVKELKLSYYIGETLLFAIHIYIYTHYGILI